MARWVFGPVPSRRLGKSLGIDPVRPKTCNWNCVYCQLGRSVPVVCERREYVPAQEILDEVKQALEAAGPGQIDWVTFVASGETTLNSRLGWLIRRVKEITDLPVAVITNGSLLHLAEVREEIARADAVLPSVDAGDEGTYRAINRPHPSCTFADLVDGLSAFRRGFRGRLWVETMLVRGVNDSEPALRAIRDALDRIGPDAVQVNVPTRPPAEAWVRAPLAEDVANAVAMLGAAAEAIPSAHSELELAGSGDIEDLVLGVISRHPMRAAELVPAIVGRAAAAGSPVDAARAHKVLERLKATGRARTVQRQGETFWVAAYGRYGEGGATPTE